MTQVAPTVIKSSAASALPGAALLGPGAVTAAQRVGAAIQTAKHGDKIIKALPHAKDFIEAAAIPGPPAMTKAAVIGSAAKKVYDEAQKRK